MELLIVSVGFTAVIFRLGTKEKRDEDDPVILGDLPTGPWSRSAPCRSSSARRTLLAEAGGGLYWTLAGIVLATVAAVANAWVLLVEILR